MPRNRIIFHRFTLRGLVARSARLQPRSGSRILKLNSFGSRVRRRTHDSRLTVTKNEEKFDVSQNNCGLINRKSSNDEIIRERHVNGCEWMGREGGGGEGGKEKEGEG